MLNLAAELATIVDTLNEHRIAFAVCGGIAMAIHGFTRATEDIDLFVPADMVERLEDIVAELGFIVKARPMTFSGGTMQIRRVSKIDPDDGDLLMLDLLLVTPDTAWVWDARETLRWRDRAFPVVSREGLIALKRFRSSEQDVLDIKRLESGE